MENNAEGNSSINAGANLRNANVEGSQLNNTLGDRVYNTATGDSSINAGLSAENANIKNAKVNNTVAGTMENRAEKRFYSKCRCYS